MFLFPRGRSLNKTTAPCPPIMLTFDYFHKCIFLSSYLFIYYYTSKRRENNIGKKIKVGKEMLFHTSVVEVGQRWKGLRIFWLHSPTIHEDYIIIIIIKWDCLFEEYKIRLCYMLGWTHHIPSWSKLIQRAVQEKDSKY